MLTILALLATLMAAPWTDPFVPASAPDMNRTSVPPIEQWASYWSTPVSAPVPMPILVPVPKAKPLPDELQDRPILQAKSLPVELCDSDPPHAGRLSVADFLSPWEVNRIYALASELTSDLVATAMTSQVISSRAGERVVLSALLCQARQLLGNENTHTTRAGRRFLVAQQDRAQLGLDMFGIQSLACNAFPVVQLMDCLDLVPAPECTTNSELAAQVRAARKLGTP